MGAWVGLIMYCNFYAYQKRTETSLHKKISKKKSSWCRNKSMNGYLLNNVAVLWSAYHCGIFCLCVSASAFIDSSLHQLDFFLEIFLWRSKLYFCCLLKFSRFLWSWKSALTIIYTAARVGSSQQRLLCSNKMYSSTTPSYRCGRTDTCGLYETAHCPLIEVKLYRPLLIGVHEAVRCSE